MRAAFAMLCVAATLTAAAPRPIVEFQRAADAYAFLHRQVERRLGYPHRRDAIEAPELAAAIIAERGRGSQLTLFTPLVVAAFRELAIAAVHNGCDAGELRTGAWEMSHDVYSPAAGTRPVSGCIAAALPGLPEELEYRAAGTVLLLVDPHANLVIDVLPGLLAGSEIR
jgi:hypothetical protein